MIEAVVEMPRHTQFKYEIKDKKLVIDRVLNQRVPYNYGYFSNTISQDGDALDLFLVTMEPIPPLTHVKVKIVGGFACLDGGIRDDKLVAVIVGDNTYPQMNMIRGYLDTYKNDFQILKELSQEEAMEIYEKSKI